ncbi:MAG: endo-1,4-beta-xylanase [Oscillospiraceae bacterium]|nr:endo-1,4-beta-xylanase [Oscillospiraceae bacterium]
MRKRRLTAGLTAIACSAAMLTVVPMNLSVQAAELVNNTFEEEYEGWIGNADSVVLSAEENMGYKGSRGMLVSDRSTSADGACSYKGFYLVGGQTNSYSAMVYAETDQVFRMSIAVTDEETEETTVTELVSKAVKGGKWTELSADYKAPAGSYDFKITITTDSTDDFYFDNVVVTGDKPVCTASAADMGLKNMFGKYFRVGNILNGSTIRNSSITANILKDCSSVECENETKPDATMDQYKSSGNNIAVKLDSCAAIMDFCSKNGIGMRGHTLVWHSQTPTWAFKQNFDANGSWVNSSTMDARMESYIKNLFAAVQSQYPNLDLYAYDVCNECISDDSNRTSNGKDGAREGGVGDGKSPWVQVYGNNSFIEKAFTYARQYAPKGCKLFYNDYNEYWDHKRDCIYNMCKNLYNKGVLDGVGMQSHINADWNGFSGMSAYETAMRKYASIGCEVQATELDISVESGKYSDYDQAKKYEAIFKLGMEIPNVTAICIWGPNDANSWLSSGSNALLYNSNNQPKTAYNTLTQVVSQSDWLSDDAMWSSVRGSSYEAPSYDADENGYFFHTTFENGAESWTNRGNCSTAVSSSAALQGSKSIYVSDRTEAWMGTCLSLSPAFKAGETYSFSSNVMYDEGSTTDTFYMKIQYTDASGETQYDGIAEASAIKGEWVQLANTAYTIPSGASDIQLYLETAESTVSFYADEIIGAEKGTTINGPKPKKVLLGDVDCDGVLTASDLSLLKRGILTGKYDNSVAKVNADVDQSYEIDEKDAEYLHQFLMTKITEFPVAERKVDFTAMAQKFSGLSLEESWKKAGENNSLYTQRFGADPGWMVYKDRLYVYTTNDAYEYKNGQIQENSYDVRTLNCVSSADLVNWTDHGAIPVAGNGAGSAPNGAQWASKWASRSWAPDACWKTINGKDKFFLYFANNGSGIGVLTADSPTGPWTDPLGHELISRNTPNCSNVEWLFDPGVYVDEATGTGYLNFGGGVPSGKESDPGTGRIVQLGDDMISIVGTPTTTHPPYLFEDSSLIKIDGTWYYSFCHNWNVPGGQAFRNADIGYMTSSSPLGPYTYQGVVFKNTGDQGLDKGGNNHHSVVAFKGKYYVLYHTRAIELRMGTNLNYRSPSIDVCNYSNGKLSCSGSMKGVSQIESLDPFTKVQAETMASQSKGISVTGLYDTVVNGKKGSWTKVAGVDCGSGVRNVTMRASSAKGAVIRITTGSTTGTAVSYIEIPAGGQMTEITVPVLGLSGNNDLYFSFSDEATLDYWVFS